MLSGVLPPAVQNVPCGSAVDPADRGHQPVIDAQYKCHSAAGHAGHNVGRAHQQASSGVFRVVNFKHGKSLQFGDESHHDGRQSMANPDWAGMQFLRRCLTRRGHGTLPCHPEPSAKDTSGLAVGRR